VCAIHCTDRYCDAGFPGNCSLEKLCRLKAQVAQTHWPHTIASLIALGYRGGFPIEFQYKDQIGCIDP
jgi:hypothetical protein